MYFLPSISEEHEEEAPFEFNSIHQAGVSGVQNFREQPLPESEEVVTDPRELLEIIHKEKAEHSNLCKLILSISSTYIDEIVKLRKELSEQFDVVSKLYSSYLSHQHSEEIVDSQKTRYFANLAYDEHLTALSHLEKLLDQRYEQCQQSNLNNIQVEAEVHASENGDATIPQPRPPSQVENVASVETAAQSNGFSRQSSFVPLTPSPSIDSTLNRGPVKSFIRRVSGFATQALEAMTPKRRTPTPTSFGIPFNYSTLSSSFPQRAQAPMPQYVPQTNLTGSRVQSQTGQTYQSQGMSFQRNLGTFSTDASQRVNPSSSAQFNTAAPLFVPTARVSSTKAPGFVHTKPRVNSFDPNSFHYSASTATTSPDAWIFENDRPSFLSCVKPPKLQLSKFDGNPLNWPLFIQTFKVQVHDVVRDDAQRIAYLGNALPHQVKLQLGQLIIVPALYRHALAELHRLYGSRTVIVKACTAALENLKPFGNNDHQGLIEFSASLRSIVATLQLSGFDSELNSYSNVNSVLKRVSPKLVDRWNIAAWGQYANVPNLIDLSDFLYESSMIEYTRRIGTADAVISNNARTSKSFTKKTADSSRPFVAATAVQSACECPACNQNHNLSSCPQFLNVNMAKRVEVLRKVHVCLMCLTPGHSSKYCPDRKRCGEGGCNLFHHPLIHGAPRIFNVPSQPAQAPVRPTQAPSTVQSNPAASVQPPQQMATPSTSSFAGAINRRKGSYTMLPIVPVVLEANGKSISTYAFLDQGSEMTLLREDLANMLHLNGPAISITVDTVNGPLSQSLFKLPKFSVSSKDRSSLFEVSEAFSIANLKISVKTFDPEEVIGRWKHLAGIDVVSPHPSEVGLLIGADQPSALEVIEYKKDPLNGRAPRGLLTPFGWTIVGPTVTNNTKNFSCYGITLPSEDADDPLLKSLRLFLGLDLYGADATEKKLVSPSVQRALNILNFSIRLVDNHYEIGLLWADDNPELPNNRDAALKRFYKQEARILKESLLAVQNLVQ